MPPLQCFPTFPKRADKHQLIVLGIAAWNLAVISVPGGELYTVQAEGHGGFQVFQVRLVLAHGLAGGIGQLGHRAAVDVLQLDDDVQSGLPRVIGAEGADAEGHLGPVLEIVV